MGSLRAALNGAVRSASDSKLELDGFMTKGCSSRCGLGPTLAIERSVDRWLEEAGPRQAPDLRKPRLARQLAALLPEKNVLRDDIGEIPR